MINKNDNVSVPLLYTDIKDGMKVIDKDGDVGTIISCTDPHNVFVECIGGGGGFYCLDDNCVDNDLLYRYN